MKKLITLLIAYLIIPSITLAHDPPKGLEWGMSYKEVKSHLEGLSNEKKVKVRKLQKKRLKTLLSRDQIPSAISNARLGTVKLFGEKSEDAFVFFHEKKGLCGVEYIFDWINDKDNKNQFMRGRDHSWKYYQNLVKALTDKYGSPEYDETDGKSENHITPHTKLSALWLDHETNDTIKVTITRQQRNAIVTLLDQFFVVIEYRNVVYENAVKEAAKKTDEI